MEDVVTVACHIEKTLEEQTDTKMEHLVSTMQDQIRLLKKDLKEANDQIAAHRAAAPPVAAMAAVPNPATATAAAAQPPPAASARHIYQDYGEEPPFYRPPRRQMDRRPPRCFLCGDEGHFMSNGPPMPSLPASARQCPWTATRTNPGAAATRGRLPLQPQRAVKLLEGSPEAKVTPVGCTVGPPITGQLNLEGIPVLGLVDTGTSVTCMGFSVWWQYRVQWGPLKPFEGVVHGAHGKPPQIAGKTQYLNLQWGEARGRASFIVIISLESPPVLIGMDIMRMLCVRIDVTHGTATNEKPDLQTIHLNAAQKQDLPPPPPQQRSVATSS